MIKNLKVTCESDEYLPLSAIRPFQGELKSRTEEDYEHLIRSFIEHGFSFPFFIWKHDVYDDGNITTVNDCLDGHGRIEALRRLEQSGCEIPLLPVTYIDCESEHEAKLALVYVNSLVGKYTEVGLQDFILGLSDFDITQYHFAGVDTQAIHKKLEKLFETEQFIQSVQPDTPPPSAPQPPLMQPPSVSPAPSQPPVEIQVQSAEFVTGVQELPPNLDVPEVAVPAQDTEVVVVCKHCQHTFRHKNW